METTKLILIIILVIIVGYLVYKFLPFNYTKNIAPFWNTLFSELDSIKVELQKPDLSEEERNKLLARQEEVYNILNNFFGKDIRNEMV